jgi:hypothetical protein
MMKHKKGALQPGIARLFFFRAILIDWVLPPNR